MSDPNDIWEDEGSDREYMTEEEYEAVANGQYIDEGYQEVYEDDPNNFMDVYEEEYEDMEDEELQAKTDEVLDGALIRLEQGRLYKMIMETIDGGMFEDTGCDERSIKNVEREMKAFIMSRLEVLLGIRKKAAKKVKVVREKQENQLSDVEVAVIKKLTNTAIQKSGIKPVSGNSGSLKKVGAPKQAPKPQPKAAAPAPKPKPKRRKKATKSAAPKKKVRRKTRKSSKSFADMTDEEKLARNQEVSDRQARNKVKYDGVPTAPGSPAPLPPPTGDEMAMYHQQQAQQMPNGTDLKGNLTQHILNALNKK